jgi:hypothetical protein
MEKDPISYGPANASLRNVESADDGQQDPVGRKMLLEF